MDFLPIWVFIGLKTDQNLKCDSYPATEFNRIGQPKGFISMKLITPASTTAFRLIMALFFLKLAVCVMSADTPANATNSDSAALGQRVEQLLEHRNVNRFAHEMTASLKDWRDVRPTNTITQGVDTSDSAFEKQVARERLAIANSARLMLEQAARFGLDSGRVHLHVKEVQIKGMGTFESRGMKLPSVSEVKIILLGEPVRDVEADKLLRGEYELSLGGMLKFPGGWRSYEGIRWNRFPKGVADEQMAHDLVVVSKVSAHGGPLQMSDDPALAALGQSLISFLKQRDQRIFTNAAMRSFEEIWNDFESKYKNILGAKELPTRKEVEEPWSMFQGQIASSARSVLDQLEVLGVDFTEADITLKNVVAENPHQREVFGAVAGIDSNPLRFMFTVQSDQKSKAGRSISGDYILTAGRARRSATRWTIENKIRWEKFPDGLLGPKELTDLAFENYVAENGALPSGTIAPDIEFVRIDNATKVKLSDYRGKVVLLDFWATSCGPCQEPLAHLQTLREQNPNWKDRVQIITLSIDDELSQAQKHLAKRGWTNTFNTWAGPGNWSSTPAKQFRVTGIPTLYVIDGQGKVVNAGHFIEFTNLVTSLLK